MKKEAVLPCLNVLSVISQGGQGAKYLTHFFREIILRKLNFSVCVSNI